MLFLAAMYGPHYTTAVGEKHRFANVSKAAVRSPASIEQYMKKNSFITLISADYVKIC